MVKLDSEIGKDQPRGRSVLLYSGGLDTFILAIVHRPDIILYIRHGAAWEDAELDRLHRAKDAGIFGMGTAVVINEGVFNLSSLSREDLIIPNRNTYFVLMGANYGERILLGGYEEDMNSDKDLTFCWHMSGLLNHIYRGWWSTPRNFSVECPHYYLGKIGAVQAYLRHGEDIQHLVDYSYSCMQGGMVECGECRACLKNYLAGRANGVDLSSKYAKHPLRSQLVKALLSPTAEVPVHFQKYMALLKEVS